jgi:hypothetical protein
VRHPGQRREVPGDGAGAAADLQQLSLLRKGERRGVRGAHRPLLRIGGAQLEHVRQLFLQGVVGLRDRHVDVGHWDLLSLPYRPSRIAGYSR